MSFLEKRSLRPVSPLEQIAELARRKREFRSLLKGDSISDAKSYFDNRLVPYLRNVFYLPVSENDFYSRALSTDPSCMELAVRLLRHADRFGKEDVILSFFDLFEGDSRSLALHFNFSRSTHSPLDPSELDLAERLFEIYDKTGYLVPKLFAAHEIARSYYGLYLASKEDPNWASLEFASKVLKYLTVLGDDSVVVRAKVEFGIASP